MAEDAKQYERNENFEEAMSLLREMKGRTSEAQERGDTEMTKMYNQLVKVISPVVEAYYKRIDRQEKAALNKRTQEMSRAEWERKQQELETRRRAQLAELQKKLGEKA